MQIFSHSPTPSSLNKPCASAQRGFTLIELLISVAIIGILTAIVVVKYKSFDSTVLLKSSAYEVALALRESQVKAMSATRGTTGFDFPRGISFTPGTQTYIAFQFTSTSSIDTEYPRYDKSESDPDIAVPLGTSTMQRTVQISDVCTTTGTTETCGLSRLDISYRRPEFKAIFYVPGNNLAQNKAITSAKIKLNSMNNTTNVFEVTASQLGQISVSKKP